MHPAWATSQNHLVVWTILRFLQIRGNVNVWHCFWCICHVQGNFLTALQLLLLYFSAVWTHCCVFVLGKTCLVRGEENRCDADGKAGRCSFLFLRMPDTAVNAYFVFAPKNCVLESKLYHALPECKCTSIQRL